MSPTYRTEVKIIQTAKDNGWEIFKSEDGAGPWGMRKNKFNIMVQANRRGGLTRVSISHRGNAVSMGPDYRGKLETVLNWLNGDTGDVR